MSYSPFLCLLFHCSTFSVFTHPFLYSFTASLTFFFFFTYVSFLPPRYLSWRCHLPIWLLFSRISRFCLTPCWVGASNLRSLGLILNKVPAM